jgi:hypothetical protein
MTEKTHTLVITIDSEWLLRERDTEVVDIAEQAREALRWSITCPYEGADWSRPCITYVECDCQFTEDERDDLEHDEEGLCPESPTGFHSWVSTPTLCGVARPTRQCWYVVDESLLESVDELIKARSLQPGRYPLRFGFDGDFTTVTLAEGVS